MEGEQNREGGDKKKKDDLTQIRSGCFSKDNGCRGYGEATDIHN